MTPGQGDMCRACIDLRVPALVFGLTEKHNLALEEKLTEYAYSKLSEEGHNLYRKEFKPVVLPGAGEDGDNDNVDDEGPPKKTPKTKATPKPKPKNEKEKEKKNKSSSSNEDEPKKKKKKTKKSERTTRALQALKSHGENHQR